MSVVLFSPIPPYKPNPPRYDTLDGIVCIELKKSIVSLDDVTEIA